MALSTPPVRSTGVRSPARPWEEAPPTMIRTPEPAGAGGADVRHAAPASVDWPRPGNPPPVPRAAPASSATDGAGAAGRAVSDAANRRGLGTEQMPGACAMDSSSTRAKPPVPSVNYHLLLACNMACGHCFAANLSKERLPYEEAADVVRLLAEHGFEKINFAGGEPLLHPALDTLIRTAKKCGMTTSVVTNGTRVTDQWLDEISEYLDWLALSIDSPSPETHAASGRADGNGAISAERYLEMCGAVRRRGIRLKINTVVTIHNHAEVMAGFVHDARPERWKIMRALPVGGQNDGKSGPFEVTGAQFDAYVERNTPVEGVTVVPEDNDLMIGSYVMVDPMGRFYDNVDGRHRYSRPMLRAGVGEALRDVKIDAEAFERRGGRYGWRTGPPEAAARAHPDVAGRSGEQA